MNHVDIICATRGRLAKLSRMVRSVPGTAARLPINIVLFVDGDMASYRELIRRGYNPHYSPTRIGQTAARNLLLEKTTDAVIYAVDDICFEAGAIETAIREFRALFPDDDGVLGFTQIGNRFHPTGISLIGSLFLNRYPNRHLFCPKYDHFACQEVHWAAVKLGKFALSENARLYHFHPDHHSEERDQTHLDARKNKARDMMIKAQREKAGLIWGINDR